MKKRALCILLLFAILLPIFPIDGVLAKDNNSWITSTFDTDEETFDIGEKFNFNGTIKAPDNDLIEKIQINIFGPDSMEYGGSYYRKEDMSDSSFKLNRNVTPFRWGDSFITVQTNEYVTTDTPGTYIIIIYVVTQNGVSTHFSKNIIVKEKEKIKSPSIKLPKPYSEIESGKSFDIKWNDVSGASSYSVDVLDITDGEPGVSVFSDTNIKGTSATVPGRVLKSGHVINVYVKAWDSSGTSSESSLLQLIIVASDLSISLSDDELDFDSSKSSETVTLTSCNKWSASISDDGKSFITLDKSSGDGSSNISVEVSKNNTDKPRVGVIEFSDATGTALLIITQATKTSAYIKVNTSLVEFDSPSGLSEKINISSNTSYSISSDVDWIYTTMYFSVYDSSFSIGVKENNTLGAREGIVTVESETVKKTIKVRQKGGECPVIEKFSDSYTIELGDDIPLVGIVRATNNGMLNRVTVKCASNQADGVLYTRSEQLNTGSFDLSTIGKSGNYNKIFTETGIYKFNIYVSASNYTVTDNLIETFTVNVISPVDDAGVTSASYSELAATSVTFSARITSYGSGKFSKCGFELWKVGADDEYVETYNCQSGKPVNVSQSFSRSVPVEPNTTYKCIAFLETTNGIVKGKTIKFSTPEATPLSLVKIFSNSKELKEEKIYLTVGETVKLSLEGTGDIKSILWYDSDSICQIKGVSSATCSLIGEKEGVDNVTVVCTDYFGNTTKKSLKVIIQSKPITTQLDFSDSLNNEITNTHSFTFNNNFFAESSLNYNHNLAKLSLGFVLAASSCSASPDVADAAIRSKTINLFFENLGFLCEDEKTDSYCKTYNYQTDLYDDIDDVAFAIARKKIVVGEKSTPYTLIVIATRGGNYGAEWVSNFEIGPRAGHTGFNLAGGNIYANFVSYIDEHNIDLKDDNVKVLITGFSRSAAASNYAASKINELFKINGKSIDDVYAYTFATPNNQLTSRELYSGYENIFNIVSPDDLVAYVPMTQWSFGKYGVTLLLPSYSSEVSKEMLKTLDDIIAPEKNEYGKYSGLFTSKGEIFQTWSEQEEAVKVLCELLVDTFGSREEMYENYDSIINDFAELYFEGRVDFEQDRGDVIIDILKLMESGEYDEVLGDYKGILCYCVTWLVLRIGLDKGQDIMPITFSIIESRLEENFSEERVVPKLSSIKKLLKSFYEAFCNLSDEDKDLLIEMVTGMNPGAFYEMCEDLAYLYICKFFSVVLLISNGDFKELIEGDSNENYKELIEGFEEILNETYYPMLKIGGHIKATHRMETYLAWLECADEDTLFNLDKCKIQIACPVDINIYDDDGSIVGRIVNDEVDAECSMSDSLFLSVNGDTKEIVMPSDAEYRIEISPRGEGTMDVNYEVSDENGKIVYSKNENVVTLNSKADYKIQKVYDSADTYRYELSEIQYNNDCSITFDKENISLTPGSSTVVNASISSESSTIEPKWKSSDDTIVDVAVFNDFGSKKALIVAKAIGDVTVTVDYGNVSASFTVRVISTETGICAHLHVQTIPGIPATCTETGLSDTIICADCQAVIQQQMVIPAIGHKYSSEWTVDKPATIGIAGEKSHHCTVCGERGDITEIPALTENAPAITVESKKLTIGGTGTVKISVKNNPGFCALRFTLNLPEGVTVVSIENKATQLSLTKGDAILLDGLDNFTDNGELLILQVKASEDMGEGKYTLGLTVNEAGNADEQEITFVVNNGTIEISKTILGDTNGDGVVSVMDLIRLRKFIAGLATDIDSAGADMNSNGKVDIFDLIRLQKLLAS